MEDHVLPPEAPQPHAVGPLRHQREGEDERLEYPRLLDARAAVPLVREPLSAPPLFMLDGARLEGRLALDGVRLPVLPGRADELPRNESAAPPAMSRWPA